VAIEFSEEKLSETEQRDWRFGEALSLSVARVVEKRLRKKKRKLEA
jgi:hypothetical protein